jgi:hypothetical protein
MKPVHDVGSNRLGRGVTEAEQGADIGLRRCRAGLVVHVKTRDRRPVAGYPHPGCRAPKHSVDKESNCRPLASGGWVEVRCHGDESQRAHNLPRDMTSNGRCVGNTPCRKKDICSRQTVVDID